MQSTPPPPPSHIRPEEGLNHEGDDFTRPPKGVTAESHQIAKTVATTPAQIPRGMANFNFAPSRRRHIDAITKTIAAAVWVGCVCG